MTSTMTFYLNPTISEFIYKNMSMLQIYCILYIFYSISHVIINKIFQNNYEYYDKYWNTYWKEHYEDLNGFNSNDSKLESIYKINNLFNQDIHSVTNNQKDIMNYSEYVHHNYKIMFNSQNKNLINENKQLRTQNNELKKLK
jgi:hypothetical protein